MPLDAVDFAFIALAFAARFFAGDVGVMLVSLLFLVRVKGIEGGFRRQP